MKSQLKTLCLALGLVGSVFFSQTLWACEKPQVSGYDYIACLDEGLAIVVKDDKYGFIDKTGTVVIPLQYDDVSHFYKDLAEVKKDGQIFYIDKIGKIVSQ